MDKPSPGRERLRVLLAWSAAWVFSAALYLLLIDTTDTPELILGAVAAAIAATGLELAREQRLAGETIRGRWLARLYRPFLNAPGDIRRVSLAALAQLAAPRPARGEFRTLRFPTRSDHQREDGRRALAQSFGSFAPNTIIIGVDPERELILAHQLERTAGADAIDPLGLR
jgi:multisubunit Na+/H+ antiporter MnhE subunit